MRSRSHSRWRSRAKRPPTCTHRSSPWSCSTGRCKGSPGCKEPVCQSPSQRQTPSQRPSQASSCRQGCPGRLWTPRPALLPSPQPGPAPRSLSGLASGSPCPPASASSSDHPAWWSHFEIRQPTAPQNNRKGLTGHIKSILRLVHPIQTLYYREVPDCRSCRSCWRKS